MIKQWIKKLVVSLLKYVQHLFHLLLQTVSSKAHLSPRNDIKASGSTITNLSTTLF
jgi:hypothetical protein